MAAKLTTMRNVGPYETPRSARVHMSMDKEAIKREIKSRPDDVLQIWSDGSKLEDGRVGWGYTTTRGEDILLSRAGCLGVKAETYDAELAGALFGLADSSFLPMEGVRKIECRLDNLAAGKRLRSGTYTAADKEWIKEFNEFKEDSPVPVHIKWVPGHAGIPENERADRLAEAGAKLPYTDDPPIVSWEKMRKSKLLREEHNTWWSENRPKSYTDKGIGPALGKPKELSIPRRILGRLVAARTGHGDFPEYHERLEHATYERHCQCG